jgi:Protein of unknown function (DUF3501)
VRKLTNADIKDMREYERERDEFRAEIITMKKKRRIALGDIMTIVFENAATMRFQIQEMARAERMLRDEQIAHELETYNELVPGPRELSATIFIEYPERVQREQMLVALAGVETAFYVRVAGDRLQVVGDTRGTDTSRTMAVQYVKFPLSESAEQALRVGGVELCLGVEHAAYRAEVVLSAETTQSIRDDFA